MNQQTMPDKKNFYASPDPTIYVERDQHFCVFEFKHLKGIFEIKFINLTLFTYFIYIISQTYF